MSWEKSETESFINPYAFVPQSDVPIRENTDTKSFEKTHTGWFDCSLLTKTPLIIPDTESVRIKELETNGEHKIYDFYTQEIDGKKLATIPGSQIRGVVRNIYETITNSCMVTSRNSAIICRSAAFAKIVKDAAYAKPSKAASFAKPGILKKENDKWTLYTATRYRVLTNSYKKPNHQCYQQNIDGTINVNGKKIKNGSEVSFQYSLVGKQNFPLGYVTKILSDDVTQNSEIGKSAKGFLLMIPPVGSTKIYDSIMVSNGHKVDCNDSDLPVDTIEEIWKSYRYNVKKNEKLANLYENLMFKPNENGTPIWYEIDKNKKVHFSIAQCGRQLMKNKMYDILGDYAPCDDKELCPGCKLFGTVNKKNTRAGKVRFSDAVIDNADDCYTNPIVLEELASPHITATEFYMQPPSNLEEAFNYDYYGNSANRPKTLINGRKFYWHFTPKEQNAQETNRNATMKAVLPEQKFTFKVYYNDVTDSELEALKTALTLGENETSSRLCHKLGHGKPLGYGSAKLTITAQTERTIALDKATGSLSYEITNPQINVNKITNNESLLKIANLDALGNKPNVCYPLGEDSGARDNDMKHSTLQWFMGNKTAIDGKILVLPKILDKDNTLPKIEASNNAYSKPKNTTNYNIPRQMNTNSNINASPKCKNPKCYNHVTKSDSGEWHPYCQKCNYENKKNSFNKK